MQLQIDERRIFQLAEHIAHALAHLLDLRNEREAAAPGRCRFAHEVRIGRAADADGEEPRTTDAVADELHELRLVAHAAVGDEHDLAQGIQGRRNRERELQRATHLGAAVGDQPVDEIRRALPVDRSPPAATSGTGSSRHR